MWLSSCNGKQAYLWKEFSVLLGDSEPGKGSIYVIDAVERWSAVHVCVCCSMLELFFTSAEHCVALQVFCNFLFSISCVYFHFNQNRKESA